MTIQRASREIPYAPGLPIFGPAFAARRDLLGTLMGLYREYGPVVRTRVLRLDVVHLFGPDAAELVLRNRDGCFSSARGWERFIDHVFPGAIMGMDGDTHRYHRRIMQKAFTTRALRDYVSTLTATVDDRLHDWLGERERQRFFFAYPHLKRLTLDVASTTFMGLSAGDPEAHRANRAFIHTTEASIAMIRLNLWPLPFARGIRGRRFLEEHFTKMLHERKHQHRPDLFSHICHAVSDDGERYSDREIIDHMIFIMMAAHDTSASTLTTLVGLLARHTDWQERLRQRARALPDDRLDYDTLADTEGPLRELHWAIREALRLVPPLAAIPRVCTKALTFRGYRLEAGQLVNAPPIVNHHLPAHWPEPERFDPERFSPERDDPDRHRYAWTPFGGGPHMCIGWRFGTLEIAAVLHIMLRRFRWSTPPNYKLRLQLMPIAKPRDGLPVTLERIHG